MHLPDSSVSEAKHGRLWKMFSAAIGLTWLLRLRAKECGLFGLDKDLDISSVIKFKLVNLQINRFKRTLWFLIRS